MESEYLFVYGLFRDSSRGLLDRSISCGKSTIDGKIYKVNEFYPGFIPGDEGKVVGDVYIVNESIFENLDEFEGDEYIRVRMRTSSDIECWVYQYKYPIDGFEEIIGGDWMLR